MCYQNLSFGVSHRCAVAQSVECQTSEVSGSESPFRAQFELFAPDWDGQRSEQRAY